MPTTGETYAHLPAQSAFASWRSGIGSRPFPVNISASGDRAIQPWVKTDSGQIPPRQLTAGSDLNVTAEGPWVTLIDAGILDFDSGAGWKPSTLKNPAHVMTPANYGEVTSVANFGFRGALFNANEPIQPAIANLPGPIPDPRRPMWNVLPAARYNERVTNSNIATMITNNANVENQNAYPVTFTPTGVASLNPYGGPMQEVLL